MSKPETNLGRGVLAGDPPSRKRWHINDRWKKIGIVCGASPIAKFECSRMHLRDMATTKVHFHTPSLYGPSPILSAPRFLYGVMCGQRMPIDEQTPIGKYFSRTASITAHKVTTDRMKKVTQYPNRGDVEADDMVGISCHPSSPVSKFASWSKGRGEGALKLC
jgi:hypothetical protein